MARAAAILIDGNQVALIERNRQGKAYYLFPGGTVEQGETLEEACIREIHEELGLSVLTESLIAEVIFQETHQYYYLCKIQNGVFGTGDGEEYHGNLPPERGTYKPVWLPVEQLLHNPVQPKCVCELILSVMAHTFTEAKTFLDHGDGFCEPIEP